MTFKKETTEKNAKTAKITTDGISKEVKTAKIATGGVGKDDVIVNHIWATRDLNQFTENKSNRKLKPKHVEELKANILLDGQITPISVTPEKVLIDGHHRLEAIKQLIAEGNKDITLKYYIIDKEESVVGTVNSTQLTYDILGWLNHYMVAGPRHVTSIENKKAIDAYKFFDKKWIQENFKEYINYQELTIIFMNINAHSDKSTKQFKNGELRLNRTKKEITDILNWMVVKNRRHFTSKTLKMRKFQRTLLYLKYEHSNIFDENVFTETSDVYENYFVTKDFRDLKQNDMINAVIRRYNKIARCYNKPTYKLKTVNK